MNKDDPLITKLRLLDSQHSRPTDAMNAQQIVQGVLQLRTRRRIVQRRVQVAIGGTLCLGCIAAAVWWYPKPAHESLVAIQAEPPQPSGNEQVNLDAADPSSNNSQTGAIRPTADSPSIAMDDELTAELVRARSSHAQIRKQIVALEEVLLREELSRNNSSIDVEVKSSLFF